MDGGTDRWAVVNNLFPSDAETALGGTGFPVGTIEGQGYVMTVTPGHSEHTPRQQSTPRPALGSTIALMPSTLSRIRAILKSSEIDSSLTSSVPPLSRMTAPAT